MNDEEALETAPEGTVVVDSAGDWALKHNNQWHGTGGWALLSEDFAPYGPFRIVSRPVDESAA